jgi:hypothetical protein
MAAMTVPYIFAGIAEKSRAETEVIEATFHYPPHNERFSDTARTTEVALR